MARWFLVVCLGSVFVGLAGCEVLPAEEVEYQPARPYVPPADACLRGNVDLCAHLEAAEDLCGVYLPPQENETTWSDEELTDVWTYHATQHTMARLRDAPMTHRLTDGHVADPAAFETWRRAGQEALHDLLRLDAASWPDTPLDVRALDETTDDGLVVRTIDYLVEPGQRIPAYVVLPDGPAPAGGWPGVVLWHGHGAAGREALVAPREDGATNIYAEGATKLARAGFVVLAPDIRSFGETGSTKQHEHFTQQLLLDGRVAVGVFVADAQKALDVLEALPEVNPERLAMGGTSLGGEVTLFTAAVDSRIRVAVVAGYLASYRETTLGLLHCVCQYVPVMGRTMDVADVAALVAPRRLAFVTGERDSLFPVEQAEHAFAHLERAWEHIGATDAVTLHVHDGGHLWIPSVAASVFQAGLRP